VIYLKENVRPLSLLIAAAVANVAQEWSVRVVITSGNDSTHMDGSKHYSGEALDIRSKTFESEASKRRFMSDVLARLGPDYQAILEDHGGPNEHIHIEHDPNGH
jgi:hypothetical protein